MKEVTLHKKVAFAGKLLTVEQHDVGLGDGRTAYREIIRHPGAIGVLARRADGRFVMVRQYRKAVEMMMTEIVAGMLDAGEQPADAAHRELTEETGSTASMITHLGTVYASPGYVDEKVEVYLAELDHRDARPLQLDHGEQIETVVMTREALSSAIRRGEIHDAKTLAAWALFLEHERKQI